jgi:hypothetical protein
MESVRLLWAGVRSDGSDRTVRTVECAAADGMREATVAGEMLARVALAET